MHAARLLFSREGARDIARAYARAHGPRPCGGTSAHERALRSPRPSPPARATAPPLQHQRPSYKHGRGRATHRRTHRNPTSHVVPFVEPIDANHATCRFVRPLRRAWPGLWPPLAGLSWPFSPTNLPVMLFLRTRTRSQRPWNMQTDRLEYNPHRTGAGAASKYRAKTNAQRIQRCPPQPAAFTSWRPCPSCPSCSFWLPSSSPCSWLPSPRPSWP